MSPKLLLYFVTEDRYFLSHRLPMARAAQALGYRVAVLARETSARLAIEAAGIQFIPLTLDRGSLNPVGALGATREIVRLYRRLQPWAVHHIAMKPVLFGSIAAWIAGVPRVVNAFAGLGFVFSSNDPLALGLRHGMRPIWRAILRRPNSFLLLQNPDDLEVLSQQGVVPAPERVAVVRGSGVDTEAFPVRDFRADTDEFICVFSARMIAIKGLSTLEQAFQRLQTEAPHVRLWLCGAPDPANPGSWSAERLENWQRDSPNVIWKGHQTDMSKVWAAAHLALQPSWGGEGVPKALLEAAASGRAIVASDVPGCREVVRPGENGLLVPARNSGALADAILSLARDPGRCQRMGAAGRRLVEAERLTSAAVTEQMREIYGRWLGKAG